MNEARRKCEVSTKSNSMKLHELHKYRDCLSASFSFDVFVVDFVHNFGALMMEKV